MEEKKNLLLRKPTKTDREALHSKSPLKMMIQVMMIQMTTMSGTMMTTMTNGGKKAKKMNRTRATEIAPSQATTKMRMK